jgi:hypothetical protein
MANTIYIKSSQTADSTPDDGSQLAIGEVAINTADGFLFMAKKTASSGGAVGDAATDGSVVTTKVGMPIVDADGLSTSDATLSTTGNVKAYADTMLPLVGGTMAGHLVVPTNYDVQIADAPSAATDAANKAYVDAEVAAAESGLDFKDSVVAATVQKVCIKSSGTDAKHMTSSSSGTILTANEQTLADWTAIMDAETVGNWNVAGKRILLMTAIDAADTADAGDASGPTTHAANGVYEVTTIGIDGSQSLVLTRADDFDTMGAGGDVSVGAYVFVGQGATLANNAYVLKSSDNWSDKNFPVIDTTPDSSATTGELLFAQFSGAGQIIAGAGLSKSVNTLAIDLTEFSEVVPATNDAFLTLDSDNSTEQLCTIDALATKYAGADLTALNGVIGVDDAFVQNDTDDAMAGVLTVGGGTPTLILANGSITDTGGAIAFGDENLSTTGTLGCGVLTAASSSVIGNLTLGDGSIVDSGGAISFGDENLSTTGTLGAGVTTVTGLVTGQSGTVTFLDANGTTGGGFTSIKAHATTTADIAYTLPAAGPGTSGFVLASTDVGVMSWVSNADASSAGTITVTDTATNAVTTALTLKHASTGVNAIGGGVGLDFTQDTGGAGADNFEIGMQLEAVLSDVANTTEDIDFSVKLMAAGVAAAEKFKVSSIGDITFAGVLDGGSF